MTIQRGDIVLVRFPFASGAGSKVRPALVVQSDRNNRRLTNVILAPITSTIHRSHEPTQLLVELSTPAGRQSGLLQDSVVSCENLATVEIGLILQRIGGLPAASLLQINDCLKAALDLP